jgi:hypothetical protein
MGDNRLNLVGGSVICSSLRGELCVNIAGDSFEEDVLQIGVLGYLVNLLQKLGEAVGFVTRGVICLGVVDEVIVRN